jgi:hypothetical protein
LGVGVFEISRNIRCGEDIDNLTPEDIRNMILALEKFGLPSKDCKCIADKYIARIAEENPYKRQDLIKRVIMRLSILADWAKEYKPKEVEVEKEKEKDILACFLGDDSQDEQDVLNTFMKDDSDDEVVDCRKAPSKAPSKAPIKGPSKDELIEGIRQIYLIIYCIDYKQIKLDLAAGLTLCGGTNRALFYRPKWDLEDLSVDTEYEPVEEDLIKDKKAYWKKRKGTLRYKRECLESQKSARIVKKRTKKCWLKQMISSGDDTSLLDAAIQFEHKALMNLNNEIKAVKKALKITEVNLDEDKIKAMKKVKVAEPELAVPELAVPV